MKRLGIFLLVNVVAVATLTIVAAVVILRAFHFRIHLWYGGRLDFALPFQDDCQDDDALPYD